MIDVIKQTPFEYSNQSRDYQLIARIYTILYNSVKQYIDNMKCWSSNIDNKLTTLRAKTLNFDPKHQWDLDPLDSVVSCFKYIMRYKGTYTALQFCLTILMRVYNLEGDVTPLIDGDLITVRIPKQLASIGIVLDLLDYILPAGMTYRIVEYKLYDQNSATKILYNFDKASIPYRIENKNMGIMNKSYFTDETNPREFDRESYGGLKYTFNEETKQWLSLYVGDSDNQSNQGFDLYHNFVSNRVEVALNIEDTYEEI